MSPYFCKYMVYVKCTYKTTFRIGGNYIITTSLVVNLKIILPSSVGKWNKEFHNRKLE